jgi:hypothetical protein
MALGLKRLFGGAPSRGRLAAWIVVVLAVLAGHALVTRQIMLAMDDKGDDDAMPPRIEVAYVREMKLAEPAPMAAPAAPPETAPETAPSPIAAPAPKPKPKPKPKPAPKVVKPVKAASAPDDVDPDTKRPVVAVAASPVAADEPGMAASEAAKAEDNAASEAQAAASSASVAQAAASSPQVASAATPASAPASGALANFEWPTSTRISYVLTGNYRGPVNGSGQVEWIRVGSHYQVHVDLIVGASAAPLITRRMSSDGDITAQGLTPRRFDQETKVMLRSPNHQSMSFEPGWVVLANGDRRLSVPGVQDSASQFVQLTYVFSTRPDLLKVGGTVDIPLALPHKVDVWTYDVVGEEVLYAPWGPLPTVHLKPQKKNLNPNSLSAEIWFAPQLRYLPVRILIRQDENTYVDMMVEKPPEIGAQ